MIIAEVLKGFPPMFGHDKHDIERTQQQTTKVYFSLTLLVHSCPASLYPFSQVVLQLELFSQL